MPIQATKRGDIISLDGNPIYDAFSQKAFKDILPGHIRAEMAKAANCTEKTTELRKWLMELLIASKAYWKGQIIALGDLCNEHATEFTCAIGGAGAGAISYSNGEIVYTEAGVPSGAFDVLIQVAEYHNFKIRNGWAYLGNQDVGVTITVKTQDGNATGSLCTLIDQELDNALRSISQEVTALKYPAYSVLGEKIEVKWAAGAEIDAASVAKLFLAGEVY